MPNETIKSFNQAVSIRILFNSHFCDYLMLLNSMEILNIVILLYSSNRFHLITLLFSTQVMTFHLYFLIMVRDGLKIGQEDSATVKRNCDLKKKRLEVFGTPRVDGKILIAMFTVSKSYLFFPHCPIVIRHETTRVV